MTTTLRFDATALAAAYFRHLVADLPQYGRDLAQQPDTIATVHRYVSTVFVALNCATSLSDIAHLATLVAQVSQALQQRFPSREAETATADTLPRYGATLLTPPLAISAIVSTIAALADALGRVHSQHDALHLSDVLELRSRGLDRLHRQADEHGEASIRLRQGHYCIFLRTPWEDDSVLLDSEYDSAEAAIRAVRQMYPGIVLFVNEP